MITRRWNATGITSRGPTRADCDFSVIAAPKDTVLSSDTSDENIDADAHVVYIQNTGASFKHEWRLGTIAVVPPQIPATWESVNPEIATIDSIGVTTLISPGDSRFIARSRLLSVSSQPLMHNITSSGTINTFERFTDGSLERHIEQTIDGLIAGKSFESASPNYLNRNGSTSFLDPAIIRNPDSWYAGIDLTGIAVWNSVHPWACEAKAITPRHCVLAEHWRGPHGETDQLLLPPGTECKWITANNQIITRTVTHRLRAVDRDSEIADIDLAIVLLDSDLPESISPIALPPDNLQEYLPSIYVNPDEPGSAGHYPAYNPEMPCAWMTHRGFTGVGMFPRQPPFVFFQPQDTQQLAFFVGGVITGDSGCTSWVPVRGEAMHVMQFKTQVNGPNFAQNINGMNALIGMIDAAAGINTGYTVRIKDLSGFPA